MAVPYVFANATSAIPLSNLDNNFSTPVTIGNVAIQLGNTATTLSNLSLANVTITSSSISNVTVGSTANAVVYANTTNALVTNANLTFNGTTFTTANDASIHGITVGLGAGSISTNTAVGTSALASNSGGAQSVAVGYQALSTMANDYYNVAVGYQALKVANLATNNTAVGALALVTNSSGASNTAIGSQALKTNSTGGNNTALGYQAGYSMSTNGVNTFIGNQAGYLSTGYGNTFIGANSSVGGGSGGDMTTGNNNTIVGGFRGNSGGLDIRTDSNKIILSDGAGNVYFQLNQGGANRQLSFDGAEFFPTTDNAVSCGFSSLRWSVVYAATALINTSDRNLKQDIAELDDSEKRVAIAIKSLIKKYRFKDSVAEKGDNARIHVGAIAQEVASAFEAEGLDPTRYGLFCSDTWYEVDGKKLNPGGEFYKSTDESVVAVTQLGLRYEELLAFVISAL
jgi:hypothetical protein